MAHKSEISWRRVTDEGEKIHVYARHVGREWEFFQRHGRRYDQWQPVEEPPLEDWLELLDAIRRLITRRRHPPDEEQRVQQMIRSRFPEWRE